MAAADRDRKFGLSAKARRVVLPVAGLAVAVVIVGTVTNRGGGSSAGDGPVVGDDLHAVGRLGDRLVVGGHGGAGYRPPSGGWTQIDTLDDKDVMGWADSDGVFLAGGHAGLYRSTDGGDTFAAVEGLPISDVHALGASGSRVYLGSPETGVLVSNDGGAKFEPVTDAAGQDFMGSIWVDPSNADIAVAPSMQGGAVETTDGGRTWSPLGSSSGAMAVAVSNDGQQIVALGMNGAERSMDAGATWNSLDVPDATSAATYTSQGDLVVAALSGDRAQVYKSVGSRWTSLR
ncbi:hypothetical protein G5V59_19405 [Nocardioides sp. W3-2-3]|uniref:WD40/YVTN/BNR-like repeat-containing protein n=1 Tax=Nocardioides convexus TaxID=2712224 RepID=UPI002418A389|nr:hypothetical protein [Nocardioides convexus]NHA01286.1 hypothetical protein [Nocardioides convexus]